MDEPFRVLDLFSGVGGFSLGLERTGGFRTVAFCEIDPFCQRVLGKHWPDVPIYDDVRELPNIECDVICGGFPCQDISVAGRGAGLAGERSGLWRDMARAIGLARPRYVIVENVAALLSRGLGVVLSDLAEIGYDAEWDVLSASHLGAPHHRERIWIVAYPEAIAGVHQPDIGDRVRRRLLNHGYAWPLGPWPSPTAAVCRVDDGIPDRVDRTGALGNAVVPQIPELIGHAILQAEGRA